jgi:SAM-dependent methyltransferase
MRVSKAVVPGPTAPDGSPVELYCLLRPAGEPDLVHRALPPGAEILELGCGAGRLTHALQALGHPVVAVDQSPEMLAHVHGATTVCTDIEALALGRHFAGVLLASHLVNVASDTRRLAFLRTCRAHVAPAGAVLIQCLPPAGRARPARPTSGTGCGGRCATWWRADGLVSAVMEYSAGERHWSHAFTVRTLDDAAFNQALVAAGLRRECWLDPRCCWALARPRP